eukprot:CAMPEP_0117450660 /NCGR_PEP_ID=MMETSP0759-20121206/8588_1 /TAXON_ID=63605 /ORGANISM="Percolomonas cosmopolitus, Strain WS" /LENGTH=955 /DNA_ID=CAMNT_0005243199 /DNA_START=103 /DNA_END=2966 /DNA_ORIENTATION=+
MSGTASSSTQKSFKPCYQIVFYEKQHPSKKEIVDMLENGSDEKKYEALKHVVWQHMGGEKQDQLLMTVVKYVLSSTFKPLKKLLLYFWENVEKTDENGELLPQMMLICSHLRNDLTHPNEYVVGCTLRFLCKVGEREILEPLIPPIVQNLEHRHSYVRRQAILTIYSIYYSHGFKHLIPEAPDLIYEFLQTETDATSKRNAFVMLQDCAPDKASKYLRSIIDEVPKTGHLFQLELLRLLKKMCSMYPSEKSKYLRVIASLMNSKSSAVLYQCATTLASLSNSPIAIQSAASCFVKLIITQSDTNVKLIVLDRIIDLQKRFPFVMQKMVMDILRALQTTDLDIKKKVLNVAAELISLRNVDDVMTILKKEFLESHSKPVEQKKEGEYRRHIVRFISKCSAKFPQVGEYGLLLLNYVGDSSGYDIISFVRELVELNPEMHDKILERLTQNLTLITDALVFRIALWILGTFAETKQQVVDSIEGIKHSLRDVMLQKPPQDEETIEDTVSLSSVGTAETTSRPSALVGADGTYQSQSHDANESRKNKRPKEIRNSVGTLIQEGNFFLATVASTTLTKLALKYKSLADIPADTKNKVVGEIMMLMCAFVRIGTSGESATKVTMDDDTISRIKLCLRVLLRPTKKLEELFLDHTREAYAKILKEKQGQAEKRREMERKEKLASNQADTLINISHLKGSKYDAFHFEEDDLLEGAATFQTEEKSSLHRVVQLTGFSDPVYAEASVSVQQYDVVLDIMIVNTTRKTLQNVALELATIGDLKLVERPQTYVLAPLGRQNMRVTVKVSSTETGVIFGNIVFDQTGSGSTSYVVLNDVHIDIMDYIHPSTCSDIKFRNMWQEFEWENKIPIGCNVPGMELRDYLKYLLQVSHMGCLTPINALSGDCEFLSANLCAKSAFGEDALANVSMEKTSTGAIEGFIRIRSKTQGIALSLGTQITTHPISKP